MLTLLESFPQKALLSWPVSAKSLAKKPLGVRTEDGDARVERHPFPMTILISTQDVGAFQGGWDALLKQLFSDPLGLPPPPPILSSPSPPHLLHQAPGSQSPESRARIPETTSHPQEDRDSWRGVRLVPGPQLSLDTLSRAKTSSWVLPLPPLTHHPEPLFFALTCKAWSGGKWDCGGHSGNLILTKRWGGGLVLWKTSVSVSGGSLGTLSP